MALLEHIFISGIRSFGIDKNNAQKCKFSRPVTVFLGENGCGKTTIIESIRYALTGELPEGCNKGQGFVSDPYMHQVPSVSGQIKLNLLDARGGKATIIRIIKSEKTRNNALKFSTVDTTVKYLKATGEEETLSGRGADVNAIMNRLIGVPPAIVNNVLLCLQDQSLWPLDEGGALKVKFDLIFDSVRYNQCIETLRKRIKARVADLKLKHVQVDAAKQFKEQADQKRRRKQDQEKKLEKLIEELGETREAMEPIDKRLKDICLVEEDLGGLQKKYGIKESEKKSVAQAIAELLSNLKEEFSGSDQDLQIEIASFNSNRKRKQEEQEKLISKKQQIERSEGNLTLSVDKKNKILIATNTELKNLDGKVKERNNLIRELCTSLHYTPDSMDSNEEICEIINILQNKIKEENEEITKINIENQALGKELQQEVDKCNKRKNQIEQEIKSTKNDINELQLNTRNIKSKLKDLGRSDEILKNCEKKLASIDNDLEVMNKTFNEKKMMEQIDADKAMIHKLGKELEKLESELRDLQNNTVAEKQIENLNSDINSKEGEIDRIQNQFYDEFNELFDTLPEMDLKNSIEEVMQTNNRKVADINVHITNLEKKVTTGEIEHKHKRKELRDAEEEFKKSQGEIKEVCGELSYQNKSVEIEEKLAKLQRKKGQLSSAKIMYETFIENIQNEKCCPVCSTDFTKQQAAVKDIVETIQSKIEGIPKQLKEVEENLKSTEITHKKLMHLKPTKDKIEEMQQKIPAMKKEVEKIENELTQNKMNLKKFKEDLERPMKIFDICGKIIPSAAIYDRNRKEILTAKVKIDELKYTLIVIDSDRTKMQTEMEIDNMKVDLSKHRQNCEDNQKKKDINNKKLIDLRDRRNVVVQEQFNLQKMMVGKPELLERVKEMEAKEKKLHEKIGDLEKELTEVKEQLIDAENNRDCAMTENNVTLEMRRNDFHAHKSNLKEVQKIQGTIEEYNSRKLDEKLIAVNKELTELKGDLEKLLQAKDEISNNITNIKMQLSNQEHYFRTLKDNELLREKRCIAKKIEEDMKELKKQIGNHNYKSVYEEKNNLIRKQQELNNKMNRLIGTREELDQTIKSIEDELKSPIFKNADLEYRNKSINLKVSEEAINNLKLYVETLEISVCEFHKTRMAQINKNIRQLWRHIYRGNDIDYIEIKNEITYSGQKRNYGYKVMQMKNNTLLEMRGRCSAGQKVLACLIIRIALAESFSTNCGILALDEPTTNLDRNNIDSLCASLIQIINSRALQKNFQLLIITHDHEFLDQLKTANGLTNFYEVTRDNSGSSLITKHAL